MAQRCRCRLRSSRTIREGQLHDVHVVADPSVVVDGEAELLAVEALGRVHVVTGTTTSSSFQSIDGLSCSMRCARPRPAAVSSYGAGSRLQGGFPSPSRSRTMWPELV